MASEEKLVFSSLPDGKKQAIKEDVKADCLSEAPRPGITPREVSKQTPGTWKMKVLTACLGSPS